MPEPIPLEAGFGISVRGPVASLTLDRPGRLNSQTPTTWTWLARILSGLPGTVRVVVVRGAGRAFSAGLDKAVIAEIASGASVVGDDDIAMFQEGFNLLSRPDLVTIAAVHGHAIGAGFQLALACDVRIAARDVSFSMAEVGLGLIPDLGGTKRLLELVGYSRALDICVTGRAIHADEAQRIGLVNAVVEPGSLDVAVTTYVDAVLARSRDAVVEAKALLSAAANRTNTEQQFAERAAQLRLLATLTGRDAETHDLT